MTSAGRRGAGGRYGERVLALRRDPMGLLFVPVTVAGREHDAHLDSGNSASSDRVFSNCAAVSPGNPTMTSVPMDACGIRPDESVECWGNNQYGESNAPADQTFALLDAGLDHTCGVTTGGNCSVLLLFNPDFVLSLPAAELGGVRLHEVHHVVLDH